LISLCLSIRISLICSCLQTTVYWYIIRDTIEERVHEIHNAKRHYRNRISKENGPTGSPDNDQDADSLPLHATLDKLSAGGGEVVSDEDLRRCFTNNQSLANDLYMASAQNKLKSMNTAKYVHGIPFNSTL
jgi:E3 ubiquitin-protein ligase SHPRH